MPVTLQWRNIIEIDILDRILTNARSTTSECALASMNYSPLLSMIGENDSFVRTQNYVQSSNHIFSTNFFLQSNAIKSRLIGEN